MVSDKHGRLTVGQTEENDPDTCIGKFTFTNEETQEVFLLNKEGGKNILTCQLPSLRHSLPNETLEGLLEGRKLAKISILGML